jgi:hypothetical protein
VADNVVMVGTSKDEAVPSLERKGDRLKTAEEWKVVSEDGER